MIYFAQDRATNFIKIGYTAGSPADRVKALQTACPGELVILLELPGNEQFEKALHARFAALRERGEWFRPGTELLRYLMEMGRQDGFREGHVRGWSDGWDAQREATEWAATKAEIDKIFQNIPESKE